MVVNAEHFLCFFCYFQSFWHYLFWQSFCCKTCSLSAKYDDSKDWTLSVSLQCLIHTWVILSFIKFPTTVTTSLQISHGAEFCKTKNILQNKNCDNSLLTYSTLNTGEQQSVACCIPERPSYTSEQLKLHHGGCAAWIQAESPYIGPNWSFSPRY